MGKACKFITWSRDGLILCRIHFFEDLFVDVLDKYYRAKYYLVSFEAVAALIRMLPSLFILVSDPSAYAYSVY